VRFDYDVITQVLDNQYKVFASDEIKAAVRSITSSFSGTQVLTSAIDAPSSLSRSPRAALA